MMDDLVLVNTMVLTVLVFYGFYKVFLTNFIRDNLENGSFLYTTLTFFILATFLWLYNLIVKLPG